MPDYNSHHSIMNDAAIGFKWITLLQFSQNSSVILINLILARIIGPSDFGLVAIVTVITGILLTIVDLGLNAAIIQKEKITNEHLSTAFFLNLLMGLLLCSIMVGLSPAIAAFFEQPEIESMLKIFSVALIARTLTNVQSALCDRLMSFRKVTYIGILALAAGTIGKLTLAFLGFGAWSIIYGECLQSILVMAMFWILGKWIPSFGDVNKNSFDELLSFGSSIMISNLINSLSTKIDVILIGKYVSSSQLGIYSMAFSISTVLPQQINAVIQRVMFPGFSRIQNDNEQLGEIYCTLTKYLSLVGVPALMGIAFVSPELVPIVLTNRWAEATPVLQILCFYSITNVMGGVLWAQILKAKGYAKKVLYMTTIRFIALFVTILLGLHWGLIGVALSLTIYGWIFRFVFQHIVNRIINIDMKAYLASVIPSVVCTSLMVLCLYITRWFGFNYGLSEIALLFIMILVGALSYYLVFRLAFTTEYDALIRLAKAVMG